MYAWKSVYCFDNALTHVLRVYVLLLASNRAAAFLHLVKLNKALADAETTISLNPQWEKVFGSFGAFGAFGSYSSCLFSFETIIHRMHM